MQENIYAYTAPGADYPEYISVNERAGKVEVSVRSPVKKPTALRTHIPGESGGMALSITQAISMARAILDRYAADKPFPVSPATGRAPIEAAKNAEIKRSLDALAPKIIKPTVGRMVNFWGNGKTQMQANEQPYAAQIAFVRDDRLINVSFCDHVGRQSGYTGITLVQPGDAPPDEGPFCAWMDYQLGQAQKTEAAEAKAAALELGAARATGPSSY